MADKMLKIELKKSLIGRGAKQIATAEALGLKKPGDVTVQPDNAVKHAGFEGGQMPLARRLPKVGFNNIFATQYAIVNVADLEAAFNAGDVVDTEALKAKGLVKKTLDGVKVLGNGELTKALTVKAAAYSASAKEKIEKAGGKAEVM